MKRELQIKLSIYVEMDESYDFDNQESMELAYEIVDELVKTKVNNLNDQILDSELGYQIYSVDLENFEEDDCIFSDLSSDLSSKELGKLAWKYIYENTPEYKTISRSSIEVIENNPDWIWNNIKADEREFIKDCLLNNKENGSAWDIIQLAVDKIVTDKLGYFYLDEGKWGKLYELGLKIWNIAIKYDPIFINTMKYLEEDYKYFIYMEKLAENIEDEYPNKDTNKNIGKAEIYYDLSDIMKENFVNDFNEWSKEDWHNLLNIEQYMYNKMIEAGNKMIKENLQDIFKWDDIRKCWTYIEGNEGLLNEDINESESIDIKFSTEVKVCNTWIIDGLRYFKIKCNIPYQDNNNNYKITNFLTFKYDKYKNKYMIKDDDIKKLIGINENEFYNKVNSILNNYKI